MAYPNAVFSSFAFLGFLMCMLPFPWHPQAWSVGQCMYMIWAGLACLNQFINSIVWNGNAIDFAPVWCDISTKFLIGASIAIPAATLTINRRLYHISQGEVCDPSKISKSQKRYELLADLSISLGIPIIEMILHYVVQGHRYDIFEDIGCWPSVYYTPVAIVIISIPQIIIGCVSGIYCILGVIKIRQRRSEFYSLLSSHSNLSPNVYMRLVWLAGLETLLTIPLSSFSLYQNIKDGVFPWISWQDTHYNFSRVRQILAIYWRSNRTININLEMSRWLVVVCAFIFFASFGFEEEARRNYCTIYNLATRCFRGHKRSKKQQSIIPLQSTTYKNTDTGIKENMQLSSARARTISTSSDTT